MKHYFDLHCDTISECYHNKASLYKNELQLSIEKGKNLDKWVQTYAIWLDDGLSDQEAYEEFNNVYRYFIEQMEQAKKYMSFCVSGEQIKKQLAIEKKVALLAVEGSRVLGKDLNKVQELYDKGVRMMTLTWNGKTHVADGCMMEHANGLTPFGKCVIQKMENIGMLIDVSHLAEKGFWDVVKYTNKPFIATHSNSKAVCNHPRNLTDQQFKVFVERNGLVGMNYYPLFINGTMTGDIEEILMHIDHFLKLGGEDVIAMGSDFDGAKMPNHMQGIQDIGYLRDLLTKKYGSRLSEKFCFKNACRFCSQWL